MNTSSKTSINNKQRKRPYIPNKTTMSSSSDKKITHPLSSHALKMSPCAKEYALSLSNPFTGPAGACVPSFPALQTRKFRTFIRGTLSTSNTTGFGFIVFDPYSGATNDQTSVWCTSVGFAGNNVDMNSATANVQRLNSNSDYTLASFVRAQLRVVSCGVRVTNSTNALNVAGQVYALMEPNHTSFQNQNIAGLLSYKECAYDSAQSGKEYPLVYTAVNVNDYDLVNNTFFQGYNPTTGVNDPTVLRAYMCFLFSAPIATPNTYTFEVVWNFEAAGNVIQGKSASHADLSSLGLIASATAQPGVNTNPNLIVPYIGTIPGAAPTPASGESFGQRLISDVGEVVYAFGKVIDFGEALFAAFF